MKVNALFAGKPQPFGPRGAPSSIVKQPIDAITVKADCTEEDEQGNKKLHGGPEKVLHQYGRAGYETLSAAYPETRFEPGTIGENIFVEGMNDDTVFIGDIYQFGEVVLQVSAPRAPCNKISHRFGIKNLDRFVGINGATGWYYRVLTAGVIHINDAVSLLKRQDKTVSVQSLVQCIYNEDSVRQAALIAELTVLDDEWRQKCQRKAQFAG
ncbi:MOSC domain-containing protein [Alteromonas pelagimontana]|uniref:MOSC domain-containing protein n=1 Tax=Alteromonas pelagimontana TaxID=1858656 RepID=A0A6M4MER0_9ALTE|nr:MOSC domain-containing protein [Alteromonas pelagimontana]QJR81358.1 MOSC domain-containing protein [Alteromonas pelagimontana]